MSFVRSRLLHLLLAVGFLVTTMTAQGVAPASSSPQTENSSNQQKDGDNTVPEDGDTGFPTTGADIPSVSMGFTVPGIIALSGLSGNGAVLGFAASQGYGWAHSSDSGNSNGSVAVLQPYVGLFHSGHRTRFLLEYYPTIDFFSGGQWDGRVLQRASFRGAHLLSRRWTWFLSGRSIYGPEALEDLGALAYTDQTLALPTDTVFVTTAETGLNWRRKARQQISLTVSGAYSAIQHGPHYEAGTARARFSNGFGRDSVWYTYGEANRYSDQPGCTRVALGEGVGWQVTSYTRLGFEVGPVIGIGTCYIHLSSSFGASIQQRLTSRSLVSLSAKRELVEPQLLQSRWLDIYSGLFEYATSRNTSFAMGTSYVRGADLPGQSIANYQGFLFFSRYQWHVSPTVSLIASYHYYDRNYASQELNERHSWVFGTLLWHLASHGSKQ
jgi:hypothetical protein